ncbi:hypothetical protein [Rubrivirga marina]|uniref:hypothetical protein n=1 Tax=Rubrivirga marina TaxID=1196024 RepID=UPI00117A402F|nr:hypothetical protein [Rubrivirga marina]
MELKALRSLVLEHAGFDVMKSSQFTEAYVCHLLGAQQTSGHHKVDGLLGDIRIEIKHAVAFDAETPYGTRRRLCFRYLQGKAGKDADVYVMAGYDNAKYHYLVIPAVRLGGRRDLDFFLFGASGEKSERWQPYVVPEEHLREAVLVAARSPTAYHGWKKPDLFAIRTGRGETGLRGNAV